jgi:hypothetical protein
MVQLAVEPDGIVFGYTAKERTYKSLNCHRQQNLKPNKSKWASSISREEEYGCFDRSENRAWVSSSGDYWWVSEGAKTTVGVNGERLAFFPVCNNHPGPWHGYPVAPRDNENYEIPEDVIQAWEAAGVIDDLVAARMRRGKI